MSSRRRQLFAPLADPEPLDLPAPGAWAGLDDVEGYARRCMDALRLKHWRFEWDHALRRMGCCRPRAACVTLSRYFAEAMLPQDPETVRRTLLHELAHALDWENFGHSGHGETWRTLCAALGIPGEKARSRVPDFTPPHLRRKGGYALCHDETGEVFRYYHRAPQRSAKTLRKCYIPGRKEETLGHLVIRRCDAEGRPCEDAAPAAPPRPATVYALCHDETGEVFRHYRRAPRRSAEELRECYIPGRKEETLGHLVVRLLPS